MLSTENYLGQASDAVGMTRNQSISVDYIISSITLD